MTRLPMRRQDGVSLLEALLAAVLLAIGLLGTIGLQARAYSALTEAGMRGEATIAAEKLIGVMTSDPTHLADYELAEGAQPGTRLATWYGETRTVIPGANITVELDEGTAPTPDEVLIRIRWQRKAGDATNTHEVRAYIAGAK